MLAAWSRKHIAMAGRLGSGPALGPKCRRFHASWVARRAVDTEMTRRLDGYGCSHLQPR